MRPRAAISLVLLPLMLWGWFASFAEASDSDREGILETFRRYEALNADFLYSVAHHKGRTGKTYAELDNEVDAYADGPFDSALESAQVQVCTFKDAEIVRALFRVILATSNSASESPNWTLGYMFVCQPDVVAKSFMALPPAKQQALFSDLEFGFENAVYERPKDDNRVLELRRKLQALEPRGKQ
jgi:hypothetical protein